MLAVVTGPSATLIFLTLLGENTGTLLAPGVETWNFVMVSEDNKAVFFA